MPVPGELYEDDRFCEHCQADTPHQCRDGGHERDSSNDYQKCLVCRWFRFGMSGEYSPPMTDAEDTLTPVMKREMIDYLLGGKGLDKGLIEGDSAIADAYEQEILDAETILAFKSRLHSLVLAALKDGEL